MDISVFFERLPSNPYAWCITVIIAIISVVLAYRSIPRKKIKCTYESRRLITKNKSEFSKLNILYGGKQVVSVTVTKVTFWNAAFPTIDKKDLIERDPFSITVNNGEILDLSVLEGEDTSNEIDINKIDNCSAKIYFDYLDRKEGGIVQIVHTGDEDSIVISKKIKGGKIVSSVMDDDIILLGSIFLFLLVFIAMDYLFFTDNRFGIYPEYWFAAKEVIGIDDKYALIFDIINMLFMTFFSIISIFAYKKYRKYKKNIIPKNCRREKNKTGIPVNNESQASINSVFLLENPETTDIVDADEQDREKNDG